MTTREAEQLYETTVRLVRGYAGSMPMFDENSEPRHVDGLMLEARLTEWGVPQAVAAVHGAVSIDDVARLLRFLKDNCWDAVGAEAK